MPTQTRTPDSGPRTDRGDAHLGWTEGPQRTDRLSLGRERGPIPYALETDWPVGAAGFEPLHIRNRNLPDSQPAGRDSNLRISN